MGDLALIEPDLARQADATAETVAAHLTHLDELLCDQLLRHLDHAHFVATLGAAVGGDAVLALGGKQLLHAPIQVRAFHVIVALVLTRMRFYAGRSAQSGLSCYRPGGRDEWQGCPHQQIQ